MKNKKAIIVVSCIILCVLVAVALIFKVAFSEGESIILKDYQDSAFATVSWDGYDVTYTVENDFEREYAVYVIDEAKRILEKSNKIYDNDIEDYLFKNIVTIKTNYNPDIQKKLNDAYENSPELSGVPCAMAVTDLKGRLVAVFSSDSENNSALNKTYAGSTIKPLSVYAPAIDSGKYSWSYSVIDSPLKKVQEQDGSFSDWPVNSNGEYTHKKTSLANAVAFSTNTVAVKMLKQIGVENAVATLSGKYGMDITFEKEKMKQSGDDEVLSNIALGYLHNGVTVAEMAGYYGVFATEGLYLAPFSVDEISDKKGTVYKSSYSEKRVMKKETACIMNKMLQRVVTIGTGKEAVLDGVNVAGKTGTTTGNADNWFVGVTPEYSCAVWHSQADKGNVSPVVFKRIFENVEHTTKDFLWNSMVEPRVYCEKSGLLKSDRCIFSDKGYFSRAQKTEYCNECN